MEINEPFQQLHHNALDLGNIKLDLLVRHPRQVELEIVEEQEVAASELVLGTRYKKVDGEWKLVGTYASSRSLV